MIEVRGPDNLQRLILNDDGVHLDHSNAFYVACTILKDALDAYCQKYGANYRVYDGNLAHIPLKPNERKYLYYRSINPKIGELLVDIHVINSNGNEVCVKQDLQFPLMNGDIVTLGMLAC